MSLCSDIEYFFKELFAVKFPEKKVNFGYFQRFDMVIEYLITEGFEIKKIQTEINKLSECFQTRHICTHNMGYIDERFKSKVNTSLNIGDKFQIDQEIYKSYFYSYQVFMELMDDWLS